MSHWWAVAMLFTGGLFAGGVLSIAWERVPAWRDTDPATFRTTFAYTLRRVDRLQPALLVACLVSTLGFAIAASGTARALAAIAAGAELVVLIGSAAWLVPLQQRLVAAAPGPQPQAADNGRLRAMWLRGHLARTAAALAFLLLAAAATVI